MTKYIVLSGDSVTVEAESGEQAEAKYHAAMTGEPCPCGLKAWGEQDKDDQSALCECVKESEALTINWLEDGGESIAEQIITTLQTWTDEASGLAERNTRQQALALAWEIIHNEPFTTN